MDVKAAGRDLASLLPGSVDFDVSMRRFSQWKVGGAADVVVTPKTVGELSQVRAYLSRNGIPSLTVGATTNLLFADEGVQAVLVRVGPSLASVTLDGPQVTAGAGAWVPGLARLAMKAGLTGLEHTCGIPGTLGGLVCMNGGSQRKGIGELITSVRSMDINGLIVRRSQEECDFSYRHSIFQSLDEVVIDATLQLTFGDRCGIREGMLAILRDRRMKFPRKLPNCGSVFVSNPAMYADYGPPGKVIEACGLKGYRIGGALISPLHGNFIVNTGNARAEEILALIQLVRERVTDLTGYSMAVEVRYVRPDGAIVPIG